MAGKSNNSANVKQNFAKGKVISKCENDKLQEN